MFCALWGTMVLLEASGGIAGHTIKDLIKEKHIVDISLKYRENIANILYL